MTVNNYFSILTTLFCCFAKMSSKEKSLLDFGYKFNSEGRLKKLLMKLLLLKILF